jgi:hypothetical protein
MSLRIKRLHGVDLKRFRTSIKKPDLPMDYLISGVCYGFFSMGEMVAGYGLTHNPLEELSSILQIPEADRKKLGNEDPFKFAELTGFFLKSKKYRIVIKLHLLMKLMFHKASYFVYAYPTDQKHIERQAALGNPLRIYTGKPELAIGGDGILLPSSINVEIISKWGILKIASYQAAKKIRRWAYRLCNRS